MPPASGQPAPALRDRAERHVFTALPELPAIERRVLALLELAGADRAAAAAETGLDDTALRFAAKRARKALRRQSAPLSAGARCERAELLASDRLDTPLRRDDRRWLEIHLARCPRCIEHEALLATARDELRASFTAEPPQLPPAPQPPALEPPSEPRGQLRAVPDPEPEATRNEMGPQDPKRSTPLPVVELPVVEPTAAPPSPKKAVPAKQTSPAAKRALRALALFLVIAAAVAAAIAGIGALDGDGGETAPWNAPDAPEVRPAPLVDQ
jgi:hypothetical protein